MNLVETHAHLDDARFGADLSEVLVRATQAGVTRIITVGANLESSCAAIALAQGHIGVWATAGIHPHAARSIDRAVLRELGDLAADPRVVAIGETGLDYYRDLSARDEQRAAFEAQLDLASQIGKPVVIHVRDKAADGPAYDDVLAILRAWQPRYHVSCDCPGVFHCFSGTAELAEKILAMGFLVGVDGPITYPKAEVLRSTLAWVPLDRLLLETDCPYLPPQPFRGRRNEPAYLLHIAQAIAQLKACDVQEVARVTTSSAEHLFGLMDG